jgi:hypothetical protein
MKIYLWPAFLLAVVLISCAPMKKTQSFETIFPREDYHQLAKSKGINNERWVDRLYDHEVNMHNFDRFEKEGVDLRQVHGRDYQSRVLLSEVIVEGEILSEKENPASDVKFHTEYQVKVGRVIKTSNWEPADTILLKVQYGPVGDRYMAIIAGLDKYGVGEKAILFLEPMEKAFQVRDKRISKGLEIGKSRINADRNDPNIFQPLKKYLIKDKHVYEKTNGYIGDKAEIVKGIKKVLSLNKY